MRGRAKRGPSFPGSSHGDFCEGALNLVEFCHEDQLAVQQKHGTLAKGNTNNQVATSIKEPRPYFVVDEPIEDPHSAATLPTQHGYAKFICKL